MCPTVAPQNLPSYIDLIWFRLCIYHDTHMHPYHWFCGYGLELIPKDFSVEQKKAWCSIVGLNGLFLMELRKSGYFECLCLLIQEISSSRVWVLLLFRVSLF